MPAARAGRLNVRLHHASVHEASQQQLKDREVAAVVEVEEYGRLQASSQELQFDQELTMEIGPHANKLKLCLYAAQPAAGGGQEQEQEQELLGQGSYSLEQLFSEDAEGDASSCPKLERVQVPLVSPDSFHAMGHMTLSLRLFHSRTAGKFRDELGKEWIDATLLEAGPREGPRQVNSRSPVASPRAGSRPGSPMLLTPTAHSQRHRLGRRAEEA